jgi:hypothetical protein
MLFGQKSYNATEEFDGGNAPEGGIGIGEVEANVTECSRTEECVADGVEEGVTIGMGYRPPSCLWNVNTAEPHRATRFQPMYVVAESD